MALNPTDDLGLTTCFPTPAKTVWRNEPLPPPVQRELLVSAWEAILAGRYKAALDGLLTVTDATYAPYPSFAMRRFYYMGLAQQGLAESDEPNTPLESTVRWLWGAFRDYGRALDIALSPFQQPAGAWAGLAEPSALRPDTGAEQVNISRRMGDCQHDLMRFEEALSCYHTAFAALDRYTPGDEVALVAAAIRLHNYLARDEMIVSYYAYALDDLDRADDLRLRYGGKVTTLWDRATADWMRAMIDRAQSQQSGGDLSQLRRSLRLFKLVETRLAEEPDHIDSLRRLYIQIAETHLDLAEYYRALGHYAPFKTNLKEARVYCFQASDALCDVNDSYGKLMVELAFARYEHLSVKPYQLPAIVSDVLALALEPHTNPDAALLDGSMTLSPRIAQVEKGAQKLNDHMLMGRAKTLRADVLSSKGNQTGAIELYDEALKLFERAGARGESTRAVYGRRRAMDIL